MAGTASRLPFAWRRARHRSRQTLTGPRAPWLPTKRKPSMLTRVLLDAEGGYSPTDGPISNGCAAERKPRRPAYEPDRLDAREDAYHVLWKGGVTGESSATSRRRQVRCRRDAASRRASLCPFPLAPHPRERGQDGPAPLPRAPARRLSSLGIRWRETQPLSSKSTRRSAMRPISTAAESIFAHGSSLPPRRRNMLARP